MSSPGRIIGFIIASVMLLFSAYMYVRSGDWVALIFIIGSLGYLFVFLPPARNKKP